MTPFDAKDLAGRLSKLLGPLSEEAAKEVTKELFGWVKDSCAAQGSPFLAVVPPVLDYVLPIILKIEDSIDGQ